MLLKILRWWQLIREPVSPVVLAQLQSQLLVGLLNQLTFQVLELGLELNFPYLQLQYLQQFFPTFRKALDVSGLIYLRDLQLAQ